MNNTPLENYPLHDVAKQFSLAAPNYDQHAFVQFEVGKRLLERLSIISFTPNTILDVGAGTGHLTRKLQAIYPRSTLIGIDIAKGMNHYAKQQQSWQPWRRHPCYLNGKMEQLPFKNQSIDLIFSNFSLQWSNTLTNTFQEFKRILSPNGILLFSTLGPNTLYELRTSFQKVDNAMHVHDFLDMHDVGDALLNAQFSDPVVDMEMITIHYPKVNTLLTDLKGTGATNLAPSRSKGCLPKHVYKRMLEAYEHFKQPNSLYPATYEVIYGYACNQIATLHRHDKDGVVRIPANKIPHLL